MLNRCDFIGNLGRDPEIRTLQNGSQVCNLSLGVTESWRDKNSGERKSRTEWVRIVVFNDRLVDLAEKYLRKGSRIYIAGSMATRKWTDQSGQEKYSTEIVLQKYRGEIVMLDKAETTGGPGGSYEVGSGRDVPRDTDTREGMAPGPGYSDGIDDEIPF